MELIYVIFLLTNHVFVFRNRETEIVELLLVTREVKRTEDKEIRIILKIM